MPLHTKPLRIAIDTGGTFTDCVWVEGGRVRMLKVFSTPSDPSDAIVAALQKIIPSRATRPRNRAISFILLHGTTVGTNTLLQRKGARVALVTTAGFEDAIEIGRQHRPKLYDFFFDRVEPLVPADLRFGVNERTDSQGQNVEAPADQDLRKLVDRIHARDPESIAVSLLFSFANPQNERTVTVALQRLNLPISVSHEILPEFREYERASTVVVNAYLQPVMQRYLESLQRRTSQTQDGGKRRQAASLRSHIFVMQSSGGITALSSAAREPVRTVLSGPAGGVVGALATALRSGFDRIISFDMGGTSTDVALVDRKAQASSQSEVAGLPVGVPMLDIHTVGAGGGSLARFDAAGALRVGPESAGADPGPICYGKGTQPTVTDANLLLGRLQPERFLGGEFTLDLARTRRIVDEWLKKQGVYLSRNEFAEGVIRVVNATMEKAIRVVSIERGYDPREFTLVAFGGAGGLHACELAAALSIPRVIVPAMPGALSAFGILVSDVVKDYSRTVLWRASGKLPTKQLDKEFAALRKSAETDFRSEGWRGSLRHQPSVDVRYRGQGYELNIPMSRNLISRFHAAHQRCYGYSHPERELELVTLRLHASMMSPQTGLTTATKGAVLAPPETGVPARPERAKSGRLSTAKVHGCFGAKTLPTTLYSRDLLTPGKKYSGPAIVTEYSATSAIPPGMRFYLDWAQNLLIETRRASAGPAADTISP